MKVSLRNFTVYVSAAICLLAFTNAVDGKSPSEEFAKSRAVRITVVDPTGQNAKVASGFVWKANDLVVTNLHALPWPNDISVDCKGLKQKAKIERIYPAGDLALLRIIPAFNELSGEWDKPLDGCIPFEPSDIGAQPSIDKKLYTWGWYGGAKTGTPRSQTMGVKSSLDGLLPNHPAVPGRKSARQLLKEFGVPQLSHEVYNVQGGSLPGFSGSYVVDENHKLVAIIDGGLDEGLSSYNWIIPVRFLQEKLMCETCPDVLTAVPASIQNSPVILWSSAHPDADNQTIWSYSEVDGWDKTLIYNYNWYKIKTRTLSELMYTSANPEALERVLNVYRKSCRNCGTAASANSASSLALSDLIEFDIYEELDYGLIIATPVGQGLSYKDMEGNPGYHSLESKDPNQDGFTQYKQTKRPVTSSSNPACQVYPADTDYFSQRISELLAACNTPGESTCSVDPRTLRLVEFSDTGNKILKVGLNISYTDPNRTTDYDYYSLAVRVDPSDVGRGCDDNRSRKSVVFQAYLRIHSSVNSGGNSSVDDPSKIYADLTRTQLAQMVGVDLTTFANLGATTGGRSESAFVYDTSTAKTGDYTFFGDPSQPGYQIQTAIFDLVSKGTPLEDSTNQIIQQIANDTDSVVGGEAKRLVALYIPISTQFIGELARVTNLIYATKLSIETVPDRVKDIITIGIVLYPKHAQDIINAAVLTGEIAYQDALIVAIEAGADPTTISTAPAAGIATNAIAAVPTPLGSGVGAGGSGGGDTTASSN